MTAAPLSPPPAPRREAAMSDRMGEIKARSARTTAYIGLDAQARSDVAWLVGEVERLTALINTPEVEDWFGGVRIEAAHQIERWGAEHDAGKTPFDWFWLLGYLAQKAADAQVRGDLGKAKHHTISTAAALLNWHAALTGRSNAMRPGIDAIARGIE